MTQLALLKQLVAALTSLVTILTGLAHSPNGIYTLKKTTSGIFGSATVTQGFNYPTSSYSFSDNDQINAGDFNSILNWVGTRNSTDTTSISYNAFNPPLATATNTVDTQILFGKIGGATSSASFTFSTSTGLSVNATTSFSRIPQTTGGNCAVGNDLCNKTYVDSTGVTGGTTFSMYAAESISPGEAVSIQTSTVKATLTNGSSTATATALVAGITYFSQSFTVVATNTLDIASTSFRYANSDRAENYIANLYEQTDDLPTGNPLNGLNQASSSCGLSATPALCTITFNTSTTQVVPGRKYAMVINSTFGGSEGLNLYTSSTPLLGFGAFATSTNATSSYSATSTTALQIEIGYELAPLQLVRASANSMLNNAQSFAGFALSGASSTYNSTVQTMGILTKAGLTPGREYFLGNASGTISATAGTVSVKVGLAVNSSTLLIRIPNP